jgi:hypothetical protein
MVAPSERAGVERGRLPVSRLREGGTLASIELSTSELERDIAESLYVEIEGYRIQSHKRGGMQKR